MPKPVTWRAQVYTFKDRGGMDKHLSVRLQALRLPSKGAFGHCEGKRGTGLNEREKSCEKKTRRTWEDIVRDVDPGVDGGDVGAGGIRRTG